MKPGSSGQGVPPTHRHAFSTDLSPTPPMSPSASLGESSSDKIGNIFAAGGVGGKSKNQNNPFIQDKKFLSQRAVEHEQYSKQVTSKATSGGTPLKGQVPPGGTGTGIAIGSSAGNTVLSRIQKLSNFDVRLFECVSHTHSSNMACCIPVCSL